MYVLFNSNTNLTIDLQRLTPELVNNMSSGVPVLILRHQFLKLEGWGPLESLTKNWKKYNTGVNGFQKFLHVAGGHEKTDFWL